MITADRRTRPPRRVHLRRTVPPYGERPGAVVSEWMRGWPGFITHRLLRSHMSSSTYVNVAEWDDEQSLRAALTHPEAVGLMSALTRVSTPAPQTYRTVLEAPALEAPEGEAPPREAA
jgi:hypothetical protein